MLMSTDVASIMLPVSRGLMDRERELDTMAGVHPNAGGAPSVVRGMKRGDPEPDGQTAAALVDSAGAECKRPRIDGTGGIGEVGQMGKELGVVVGSFCPNTVNRVRLQGSPDMLLPSELVERHSSFNQNYRGCISDLPIWLRVTL